MIAGTNANNENFHWSHFVYLGLEVGEQDKVWAQAKALLQTVQGQGKTYSEREAQLSHRRS